MARLKREQLVLAALDLIDEDGAEALTMRALAARVDRQVSSLYNHIASRGELIEHIRARIVAGIDVSAFGVHPWDPALEAWARSYLTAFAAHPNVIPLLATTPIRDRSTLEMYDTVVGSLVRGGWREHDAVAVMRTVEAHVLGSALDIVAPGDLLAQASVPSELVSLRSALDAEHADASGAESAFRVGLAALMHGLRARHDSPTPN
ncbi:TetR/AcrR family transcriptional regulator [Agromyces marinus]|uniref:TetR family transcriptional regulator n=1 Tax=Agromyces marinus TaxID=1389020 RepID=A0ABM8H196_9MICO|nr:TetR/AcrR family transcriptional regulator C-terminal domain-containing protein [Agromyces marinus]UIP57347.1 Tetracycline repressor protein class E [Agromyces marinus]BDZ54549.1 TetR family transcriptional regulator [Agromyces marinus]